MSVKGYALSEKAVGDLSSFQLVLKMIQLASAKLRRAKGCLSRDEDRETVSNYLSSAAEALSYFQELIPVSEDAKAEEFNVKFYTAVGDLVTSVLRLVVSTQESDYDNIIESVDKLALWWNNAVPEDLKTLSSKEVEQIDAQQKARH